MLGTINPEILFLQQEDQIKAGLLDMKMILKITEDTYKMLGQGQIQNPPKVHLGIPEGTEWESFFNTMPSYIGGDLNIAGIKWAAESKKNATTPGIPYGIDISILSDPVTVLPFCIQDGTKRPFQSGTSSSEGSGSSSSVRWPPSSYQRYSIPSP